MNRQQERFGAFKMFKETRRDLADMQNCITRMQRHLNEALLQLERADHPLGPIGVVKSSDPDTGEYRRYTEAEAESIERQLRALT